MHLIWPGEYLLSREGKEKHLQELEDNQDQSGKKQRREDPAVSFFRTL